MAAAQRILAVDLGSSNLKVALFQVDSVNGLSLLRYGIKDMGMDPNKEQDRFPFIVETLQSLMSGQRMPAAPVHCAISGQFVFARFVKLPPVEASEIEKMIGFEAQQNVPFPINEVVWDYQLLGGRQGEVEALIVAIKQDLVEQAAAAFKAARLKLDVVDVAPLALVNAFYYNIPADGACSLLVNIGARCTNLVFVEGGKVFVRVIPIGGHLISQNVCNEFQEPYIAAEMLKKGKGFVGLGGAYQDPDDPAAARISKIARGVFSRLHAEISRSVSFYRNQQGGGAPKRIYLAGGGAAMPFADLFFKEKFNLPVEYFNPLKNVAIAPEVDRARLSVDAYQLGEVVGLGLRALPACPVEVNLPPASAREEEKKRRQAPVLAAGLAVWLAIFLAMTGANLHRAMSLASDDRKIEQEISGKTGLSGRIDESFKRMAGLKEEADAVSRLVKQRDFWPSLLAEVGKAASACTGLWISQLDADYQGAPVTQLPKPGAAPRPAVPPRRPAAGPPAEKAGVNMAPSATELNIRGFVEADQSADLLSDFVNRLKASGYFEKVEIINREPPDGDQVALVFFVRAAFKKDQRPDFLP